MSRRRRNPGIVDQLLPRAVIGAGAYWLYGHRDLFAPAPPNGTPCTCADGSACPGGLVGNCAPAGGKTPREVAIQVAKNQFALDIIDYTGRPVTVVSATQAHWTTTAMGCAYPDIPYQAKEIDGWVVTLAFGTLHHGDMMWGYHTDGVIALQCTMEPYIVA